MSDELKVAIEAAKIGAKTALKYYVHDEVIRILNQNNSV